MKAILVVDMPKSCEDCDCSFDDTDYGLFCLPLKRDIFGRDEKPSWCPLKTLPRKLDTQEDVSWYNANKIDGWNDCLNEILGEEE